ncbi:prepilin-type N-terminal cleavage/methylation domain-containing protein [Aeromonas veronii]|uniref:type IV pilus modification PilV family protein n=1 Tax=Aeromonas veronii TaxID=654 RepID=UPI0015EB5FAA|nr:prepilin-type N-terminal cleavage/methylation domain-containing protein [Aeromonas veronii]MBA2800449.1 prepilin-type N-terminal cleavage/methylation domain-containing protein [Aeromonas veronii]MCJ8235903.1 prepilin-type N-terminal cleavage/methylation domain-containing protein [Aeromonas veronii]
MRAPERGFTLIELIVGIVLLAVALTGILGLLINQAPQAVDPVQQVRAAQLAQRLAGEILQKSFDENSDHNGGRYRCGETFNGQFYGDCSCPAGVTCSQKPPAPAMTGWQPSLYGPDGEPAPYAYNDVDDFDTAGNWQKASWFTQTSLVVNGDDEYRNYQVRIVVTPDNLFGSSGPKAESIGKRIDLQIKLPDGSVLDFSFYRGNY